MFWILLFLQTTSFYKSATYNTGGSTIIEPMKNYFQSLQKKKEVFVPYFLKLPPSHKHTTGNEIDYTIALMFKSLDAYSLDIRHFKRQLRIKFMSCVFVNERPSDFSLCFLFLFFFPLFDWSCSTFCNGS